MWPSTTSGCATNTKIEMATNKQNVYVLDFADGSTTYAEGNIQMPSDWNAGTITAQFLWTNANSNTNVARWQIEAVSVADTENIDATWGTAVAVDDANTASATNKLLISAATAAVTVAGAAASELVLFRIARLGGHANDNLTTAARLIGVMISYTRT